jgi:predicted RNA-binding Zn ribbon-like protein
MSSTMRIGLISAAIAALISVPAASLAAEPVPALDSGSGSAPSSGPGASTTPAQAAPHIAAPGYSKQDVQNLLAEALNVLAKAKDVLRITSSKLPDLVTDNREFRRFDREVELCRDETYPAVSSAGKLKESPHLLRDAVRMYITMRICEQRCLRLSDHLSSVQAQGASQLSAQVFDVANRLGRVNLKLQPYFIRLIDTYQAEAPAGRVEDDLWQGTQVQGPVL